MRVVVLAAAAALAGCATPLTVGDIEGSKGAQFEISVTDPPAVVYRRLVELTRECLSMGDLQVQSEFFPDIGTGRVSLMQASLNWTLTTTKIEPAGSGSNLKVSSYDPGHTGKPSGFTRSIEAWAKGQRGEECIADTFRRPMPDPRPPR